MNRAAFIYVGVMLTVIASFLGLGAVVNPQEEDLKFYKELSEKYKEFLKANKLDAKRLDPPQPKDGSFELWSYYHLGVPTFSLDFGGRVDFYAAASPLTSKLPAHFWEFWPAPISVATPLPNTSPLYKRPVRLESSSPRARSFAAGPLV